MKRPILIATGYVSLGLGIAGVFLPLLPTTPFVLVAAWCFARSSPRLHAALLANKRLGPPLRVWQEERAISRRGKIAALGSLGASLGILSVVVEPGLVALAAVPMGAVAAYVATRPRPRSEAPATRAKSRS
ncbi:MAG: YbaN family protein [Rhodospirillales bacterium]|nr:YbaN family protein [Rhodospirillales bacterium]